jgi:hypothetical protein
VEPTAGTLVYRGRHETDPRTWVVDAVELNTGIVTRLHQSARFSIAPQAWPGGGVLVSDPGPRLVGRPADAAAERLPFPHGAGVDIVTAKSGGERFVAMTRNRPRERDLVYVVDRQTQRHAIYAPLPGVRLTVAGFSETAP